VVDEDPRTREWPQQRVNSRENALGGNAQRIGSPTTGWPSQRLPAEILIDQVVKALIVWSELLL
jgi:hypothetical protein